MVQSSWHYCCLMQHNKPHLRCSMPSTGDLACPHVPHVASL